MEMILPMLFAACAGWAFLTFLAMGIAQGSGKMESEDQARYEAFNPPARKVDDKTPPAAQTTNASESVAKSSEKILASSHGLTEITYVHRVMQRQPRYCFEYQSVDEVGKIMRERGLSFLVVLDHNRRMVGTVTMEDLARHKKQDPPEPDASQGRK
jgi:CBS domain-containing protein